MPTPTSPAHRPGQTRHDDGLSVRAALRDDSINEEARTAEYRFGSETPVPFWMNGERAVEILSFDKKHIRLDFMNAGANMLDNHSRWGSVKDCVIGIVEKAWTDGQYGYCRVRYATTAAGDAAWQLVRQKMCRWVSVGYRVFKYMEEVGDNTLAAYRAIDWEPMELSLVPVPADTSASVRSDKPSPAATHDVLILSPNFQQRNMDEDQIPTVETPAATAPPAQPAAPATTAAPPAATATPVADGARAATPAAPPAQPAAPATPVAENVASATIQACRAAGLDLDFAQTIIDTPGMTVDRARAAVLTEWETRGSAAGINPHGNARVQRDDQRVRTLADMETALMHRINPATELTEGARAWAGLSMLESFRELCNQRGVPLTGLSRRQVAEAALGLRGLSGLHSTSDFPILLGNTINRTLRAQYELQDRSWLPFSQRTTAADFREMTATQLGEASGFDKVLEGGEYKRGTTSEASEKYAVEKFGKIYGFTWEMLINDDLGAFTRMPRLIAAQAIQKQNDIVWNLLLGNSGNGQVMADGVALFNSAHNNVAASGSALSIASLAAARAAMRKHKALDGSSYLNITPKFLVVGPDLELTAFQYTSTNYVPTLAGDQNVAFITSLKVIVDPRITDNRWFLVAAPGAVDTLEYAFLEGEGELFTEQRYGFDVDGLEIKARMVFGAHVLEYRSFYKNAGA